jgi:hypothetical protein
MVAKPVSSLVPGDTFGYYDIATVTVLRAPEKHADMFGREQLRIWAKRHDTGAAGYMFFGPLAVLDLEIEGSADG